MWLSLFGYWTVYVAVPRVPREYTSSIGLGWNQVLEGQEWEHSLGSRCICHTLSSHVLRILSIPARMEVWRVTFIFRAPGSKRTPQKSGVIS